MLTEIFKNIKEVVFPRFCVGCKNPGVIICQKCWQQMPYLYEQVCPVCQHPSIDGVTHPRCRSSWGLDGVIAATKYRGISRRMVRSIKYGGAKVVAEIVPELLQKYQEFEQLYLPQAILVPIPLHTKAQQQRGYNQAEEIANNLGQFTNYPVLPDILIRHHHTISQTKLSRSQRQSNIHGAFEIEEGAKPGIRDASFILVDDVFTTGATLREAAKVLKRAGAARVYGFTLAHD